MVDLTPTEEYPGLIAQRSAQRGWGFTPAEIAIFEQGLPMAVTGQPSAVAPLIVLDGGLIDSIREAVLLIRQGVRALGLDLEVDEDFDFGSLRPYVGCELEERRSLSSTVLDLYPRRYGSCDGMSHKLAFTPEAVRPRCERWPGLDLIWALAFSPQKLAAIPAEYRFVMLGLEVGEGHVPGFVLGGDTVHLTTAPTKEELFNTLPVGYLEYAAQPA